MVLLRARDYGGIVELADRNGKVWVKLRCYGDVIGGAIAIGNDEESQINLNAGKSDAIVSISDEKRLTAKLSTDEYGGYINLRGKAGESQATLGIIELGGIVDVSDKDGKSKAWLGISEHGGLSS